MDNNLSHLGRHLLTGSDIERHTLPTPVVYLEAHGNVGIRARIGIYILFFTITCLSLAGDILTADDILSNVLIGQRMKRLVHLNDLVSETILIELGRGFHGGNGKQLHQVVLHHVAQRTRTVIISATGSDAHILDSGYLYIVNIVTVPDRFVDGASETCHHDILHRLFPKEMIDAIDILLLEVDSVNLIQLTRRCKVVAERLLNNNALQPRLLEDAGVMKIFRNQFVKQRRSSQIEQVIPIILILGRQSFQPLVQPGISKSIGRVHRLIVDSGKKIIQ